MKNFIREINDNLTRKNYLSALALSLMLPDICGKIAYPNSRSRERYSKWYNENIYKYDNPPNGDQTNPLNGEAVYKLRCSFLHEGLTDITETLKKETKEKYTDYEFIIVTDFVTRFSRFWPNDNQDGKTIKIQLNLEQFSHKISLVAEKFYEDHEKRDIFENIIFKR